MAPAAVEPPGAMTAIGKKPNALSAPRTSIPALEPMQELQSVCLTLPSYSAIWLTRNRARRRGTAFQSRRQRRKCQGDLRLSRNCNLVCSSFGGAYAKAMVQVSSNYGHVWSCTGVRYDGIDNRLVLSEVELVIYCGERILGYYRYSDALSICSIVWILLEKDVYWFSRWKEIRLESLVELMFCGHFHFASVNPIDFMCKSASHLASLTLGSKFGSLTRRSRALLQNCTWSSVGYPSLGMCI